MRATKVPTDIAVTAKGVHYVVSTVNACASCQAFQHSTRAPAASDASPLPPFRFTSLLPADWSALLRMCRRLTHPTASFNFSSPGDTAGSLCRHRGAHHPDASSTRAAPTFQNHAYMHIVERVAGDFTPNNMIYHELQSFHLLPADSVEGRPPQDTDASLSSMAVFSQLVTAMQQQAPQSPQDIAAELLDAEDTARAAATAAQKRALDPLSTNADAAAKSTANVEQLRAYAAAAMGAFQSVPVPAATATASAPPSPLAPYTFTFFPHPVPVAVSVPYCSAHFCVMVNLKPIVPNHLMVVPIRCVGTVHGLTEAEVEDWGHVMRCTIDVLEELRLEQQQHSSAHGEASVSAPLLGNYSVAVQQGALAGQTVAHLHVHVIPFDPQGKLAGEPETDELEQQRRPPRTPATMKAETDALRPLFIKYAAAAAAAAASRKK